MYAGPSNIGIETASAVSARMQIDDAERLWRTATRTRTAAVCRAWALIECEPLEDWTVAHETTAIGTAAAIDWQLVWFIRKIWHYEVHSDIRRHLETLYAVPNHNVYRGDIRVYGYNNVTVPPTHTAQLATFSGRIKKHRRSLSSALTPAVVWSANSPQLSF